MDFYFQQHTNLQIKVTNLEELSNFHFISFALEMALAHPSQWFYTNEAQPLLLLCICIATLKIFEF
jgi:hypothetical protein